MYMKESMVAAHPPLGVSFPYPEKLSQSRDACANVNKDWSFTSLNELYPC